METIPAYTEEKEGFTLRLYRLDENMSISGQFSNTDENEIAKALATGDLDWFCAKLTASKEGVELASNYLGGCCYKSIDEFRENNDHYADMVAEVISEAKQKLEKIMQHPKGIESKIIRAQALRDALSASTTALMDWQREVGEGTYPKVDWQIEHNLELLK